MVIEVHVMPNEWVYERWWHCLCLCVCVCVHNLPPVWLYWLNWVCIYYTFNATITKSMHTSDTIFRFLKDQASYITNWASAFGERFFFWWNRKMLLSLSVPVALTHQAHPFSRLIHFDSPFFPSFSVIIALVVVAYETLPLSDTHSKRLFFFFTHSPLSLLLFEKDHMINCHLNRILMQASQWKVLLLFSE